MLVKIILKYLTTFSLLWPCFKKMITPIWKIIIKIIGLRIKLGLKKKGLLKKTGRIAKDIGMNRKGKKKTIKSTPKHGKAPLSMPLNLKNNS